jgi:FkbM family methyltransferase
MSIIEGLKFHHRLFGTQGIALAARARISEKPMEVTVAMPGLPHPVHLRLRSSDLSLFEEILVNKEYLCAFDPAPRVIVDAGANIGLTSIFFATQFPEARIYSIEPEEHNHDMLVRNTRHYPNIQPIHAALWSEDVMLDLSDPGDGDWGFQTQVAQSGHGLSRPVPGMRIDSLMEQFGLDHIDLLKIDIEGAEKEVFETADEWIDRVGCVIVELHDRTKSGCSRAVYSALGDFPHEFRRGETVFFERAGGSHGVAASSVEALRWQGGAGRSKVLSVVSRARA